MPSPSSRRELLRIAAAAAAATWLPRSTWSEPRVPPEAFALGVSSGSPTHDSVVLWTRLTGRLPQQPVTVQWEIADDDGFARVVQRGQAQALPQLAHSVHVEPAGLQPDRWYFYRFMAGDAASPTGRTRTFPAPDAAASSLRLAYASCQRWEHGFFSAYRHMAQEQLDCVLFLGDSIYEYANSASPVRRHDGGVAVTLDDYRARHALYRGDPDLQAMHAQVPWLVTWDDHEVQNDYDALTPGSKQPQPDFASRRAAAYQAFYEHMPLRAASLTRAIEGLAQGAELRLYSQQRFGRLANLVLVDDRQYRDRKVCNPRSSPNGSRRVDAACADLRDPKRSLLGHEQERWLEGAFASGREGWTVLGLQTLLGPRVSTAANGTPLVWNDGWDGYAPARQRLLDAARRNGVADLAVFGGDVHQNWVGHVKADYADPASEAIGVEFCGTSITSRTGIDNSAVPALLARNPHFVFADAERKGYGVAQFTPRELVTTLRVVDDVTRRDTRIETLATFHVAAGRHRIEPG